MNRIVLMATLLMGLVTNGLAQETEKPEREKKLRIENVSGFYSEGSEKIHRPSIENFQAMNPNSQILDDDLTGYNSNPFPGKTLVKTYSINCGFQFTDKEKSKLRKKSEIRIGFNASNQLLFSTSYNKYSHEDPSNNPDTNIHYNYSMQTRSKLLQVDLSYLYTILPESWFSFYVGLGIQPGLHYSNRTEVTNTIQTYYPYSDSNNEEYYWENGPRQYRGEIITGNSGFSFGSYIPLGMDLKLCKKDPFLKSVHLFLEARPSMKLVLMPEISPYAYAYLNIGGGVRFCRQ